MEAIENYDILKEINTLSTSIDACDTSILTSHEEVKHLVATEIESMLNKIDKDTPIQIHEHFLTDILSPLDILVERVLEIRITKEVIISQLYRTLEEENIRYERNRAMSVAKKNLEKLKVDIEEIKDKIEISIAKIESDRITLSKIWVNNNLQKARDKEIIAKCERLKTHLSHISDNDDKWGDLVSKVDEIHTRRDRIEKLILTHENTPEVSELFNQIVNQEIKLLHQVLDDVIRYCKIHKKKNNKL